MESLYFVPISIPHPFCAVVFCYELSLSTTVIYVQAELTKAKLWSWC